MIRHPLSLLSPAVVATALFASPAHAAPPGGDHARGYSGAFHAAPLHVAPHYSSPHYGYPNHTFHPRTFIWYGGYPYYGSSYYPSYGYSYYPSYGYSYYPDAGVTSSRYYGAGTYPYTPGWMTPTVSAPVAGTPDVTSGGQTESTSLSSPISAGEPAKITVHLPDGAQLWFDGNVRDEAGAAREFTTPALSADKQYTYEVHARWTEGDKTVDQTQKVVFKAGDKIDMTFPMPPATAKAVPAP